MSTSWSTYRLLILGLIFHLVYIYSVFDCYFTSPVVHGMSHFNVGAALAKRLVLFVADGLRADLLFNVDAFPHLPEAPQVVAPYLREICESRGAFGVSHTRVPTESRPGHVAIIAGMYEDVSAVTKGWKTNPVDFDSVFNQSSVTFSFGSPDILPMFERGATPGRVLAWCYDEHEEDFTKDATALDVWVLDRVKELFANATTDPELDRRIRGDHVVFFLHLLGLDTTGHSYRPHSKEYMRNIQVVDRIVRDTEALFFDFFGDRETAFVFTADHGMSNIGNHGDGDPDNTRTPIIAWGSGIRGPLPDSNPSSHDDFSSRWNLSSRLRRDIEQADIAPLMSTLIGSNWPVNSVGKSPVYEHDSSVLNGIQGVLPDVEASRPGFLTDERGQSFQARASLVNAEVILEQYRVKHYMKAEHTLVYLPYGALQTRDPGESPGAAALQKLTSMLREERWEDVRDQAYELIRVTLEGLRYLQTYDRLLLRIIVAAGYAGWTGFAAVSVLRNHVGLTPGPVQLSISVTVISVVTLVLLWVGFFLQGSPWTYYIYVTFPVYFWREVFQAGICPLFAAWRNGIINPMEHQIMGAWIAGIGQILYASLSCMVLAYTHRSIWTVGFLVAGICWPVIAWPDPIWNRHPYMFPAWAGSCLITGLFTLLPVEKRENLLTICAGGVVIILTGVIGLLHVQASTPGRKVAIARSVITQLAFVAASIFITASSVLSLQAKTGLPVLNQVFGWLCFVFASSYPFIFATPAQNGPEHRLLSYFLAFGPCFVLLSISVEGLFYVSYCGTLWCWITMESNLRSHTDSLKKTKLKDGEFAVLSIEDVRNCLFFLFFTQVGFFGTGNVASISSFYLEPVYRLVPIFNPFLMASLLMFKIVAPFVVLSAAFAMLNYRLRLPPLALFLGALTLTDAMTLQFFFNVVDTGSWLEIGQSISFFCIASLLLVWSGGICVVGQWLMADAVKHWKLDSKLVDESKKRD